MKLFTRFFGAWLLLACAAGVWAQPLGPKIERVDVKYIGPATVSEQFIRSNLRLKAGDAYFPTATSDDIHSLYATGQFYWLAGGATGPFPPEARSRPAV